MTRALDAASPQAQAFWARYVASVGAEPTARFFEAFHFGDDQAMADELAELVLAGRKRATASLLWAYESENEPLPVLGGLSIVTLWSGEPVCVIETTSVEVVPFGRVTEDFAATEGEGDGSLDFWRRAHEAFFGRECERLGRQFTHAAPVVCEEFRVVFAVDAGRTD